MKLDIKMLKQLAEDLDRYQLDSLELELAEEKLVLKKKRQRAEEARPSEQLLEEVATKAVETKEVVEEENQNKKIVAPMMGTFYRASAPEMDPFVEEGSLVKAGDTLCILEAMKMMNEVKSTETGRLVKILVDDGMIVKKDQVLFEIK